MRIIDMHTHIFPEKIAARTIEKLEACGNIKAYTNGMLSGLRAEMDKSGVDVSVVLPVVTNPSQITTVNRVAYETNEKFSETGIWSFGGIHPDNENYEDELKTISEYGLKGIKLHPDYQNVFFDDIRYKRIIDKACELGLIISVHAGLDIGIPSPIHCTPDRAIKVINELHPQKLVLAHMGGYALWNEVEEIIAGEEVYLDTAFSFDKSSLSDEKTEKMREDMFLRLMSKHGDNRILFATDSPWGGQSDMLEVIKSFHIDEDSMKKILGGNAEKLLNI